MSVPKPIKDRIVAVREAAVKKTESGLILSETQMEQPLLAEVVAVGRDVVDVKTGDKIVYKEYASTELKLDDVEYLIVAEEDVLATV